MDKSKVARFYDPECILLIRQSDVGECYKMPSCVILSALSYMCCSSHCYIVLLWCFRLPYATTCNIRQREVNDVPV